ncbi:hypothetical protein LEP1GSC132_1039 [Leptospira kirschneri str. 200803703]|nr:hypothetical protein LEP1GSC064_1800 [Leptospira kirschneri serovar Grippotyphosa str. Moskva]EKR07357.1 hypothetical protein LEP1GSC122_2440 [Leptospira kirschneri serovar Valbuzzi str. 200702274]EMK04800.1 hypothetical protein LEP1GSC176_2627 [Leptospira kirschneri str. MMD1493]EMK19253.1 hypothetical protein LEP1GSC042_2285 [Leptospira kirschneri serovar Bim str. PUO 1247]EMN03263.1 hypothetical protein LEP1GSC046_3077 [Leptospira kirschneri serovar Bim str. 1051]EMN25824.1 hypothetical 
MIRISRNFYFTALYSKRTTTQFSPVNLQVSQNQIALYQKDQSE